ncbi:MAG TPA: sugar ABC transporter permease [Propionibacteriaceae bacterium]|nr:sugar ABC transporter permease [Propionibacteriaceae bacterium]
MKAARRKETLQGLAFLAPQLVGLLVFMVGPLVFAFFLAFVNWDGFGEMTSAGLSNFSFVFTDPQMQRSAINTIWFTILQVPALMIAGFITAWFLQKVGRIKNFYRVLFFAPQVTSSVAVAAIWLYLFNPQISPLTSLLAGIGVTPPDWLQDPRFIILAFAIVGTWQGLGYQIVMFMAGLENVPASLLEAADIDGAGQWQKMRKITLPLLSPTILFLSITSIIGSFQIFDYIYVFLGDTASEASRTVVYEIVQLAFRSFSYGQASALAVCLFLALLVVTGLQLVAQKRWVHYTE